MYLVRKNHLLNIAVFEMKKYIVLGAESQLFQRIIYQF